MSFYRRIVDVSSDLDPAVAVWLPDQTLIELSDTGGEGWLELTEPIMYALYLPRPAHIRLYRYMDIFARLNHNDFSIPPYEVDFIKGLGPFTPHKQVTGVFQGDVIEQTIFARFVGRDPISAEPILAIPLVREEIIYTYLDGSHQSQTKRFHYMREDGTESKLVKEKPKQYTLAASIKAGIRRRQNIINYLKPDTIGFIMMTGNAPTQEQARVRGAEFLARHNIAILAFVDTGSPQLFNDIVADTADAWLDAVIPGNAPAMTIRQYILAGLDIWGLLGG
ncbi:MAG: hypothetical protein ACPGVG_18970 [Mycobacterium sp.]